MNKETYLLIDFYRRINQKWGIGMKRWMGNCWEDAMIMSDWLTPNPPDIADTLCATW